MTQAPKTIDHGTSGNRPIWPLWAACLDRNEATISQTSTRIDTSHFDADGTGLRVTETSYYILPRTALVENFAALKTQPGLQRRQPTRIQTDTT